MLIFTRRLGEKVVLTFPGNVRAEVHIMGLLQNRRQVKVGIYAPREVIVHRGEVQELVDAPKEGT